jgi:uncharacterized protein YjbI with pentapeptide repeats
MPNPEHLAKLKQGVKRWNQWRKDNPEIHPDLRGGILHDRDLRRVDFRGADLREAFLAGADLRGSRLDEANLEEAVLSEAQLQKANLNEARAEEADLSRANLDRAYLVDAILDKADLSGANVSQADVSRADLCGADLIEANFTGADLSDTNLLDADLTGANFSGADLSRADLMGATLVNTNLERANLTACSVYGISVWNVRLEGAIQKGLVITDVNEPPIQVDNLEVAQFIYLLLNNQKIRSVIETITSKVVLILGRFTPGRKVVLEAIRDELRKRDYLPVLFDFEKPASKDLTGTISTLANMARFIIADLTDPNSVPHELATIIPNTVVPVQAIILKGRRAYPMFDDLKRRHHWVLKPYQYESKELLVAQLGDHVIAPAEAKAKKLARK